MALFIATIRSQARMQMSVYPQDYYPKISDAEIDK